MRSDDRANVALAVQIDAGFQSDEERNTASVALLPESFIHPLRRFRNGAP